MAVKVKTDLRSTEGLTVYADPASGHLYLKIVSMQDETAKLTLMSENGKVINEITVPVNQLTFIPLNNLSGLYIAQVTVNGQVLSEKFRV